MKPYAIAAIALLAVAGVAGYFLSARKSPDTKSVATATVLVCPVMGTKIASPDQAAGFSDYNGKRYYFCCPACKPQFDKEPAKFLAQVSEGQANSKTEHNGHSLPVSDSPEELVRRSGKYQIELWPPDEGIFAGEEVDVEFGVFDTTRTDSQLGGMQGVEFEATAIVRMPSMKGMPEQRPKIHREGRKGVQGVELFFPHGGEYEIELSVRPNSGGGQLMAKFTVKVLDQQPAQVSKTPPFELRLVELPKDLKPGKPVDLKMRVIETKTGQAVTKFDISHERRFHLLIASRDLTRFMHEHPTMAADGTWTHRMTFPAGGDWWIYGDVAPSGKGSQMLIAKVTIPGPGPTGPAMFADHQGPFTDRGLSGRIRPLETPIPLGKTTIVEVKLTDAATGKPAGDTTPWLGAAGHLMIIHEDGQTVVHSHPAEDPGSARRVKEGDVRFTARFPKPGRYIAYAQFKRNGEVKTLGFTLLVPGPH